MEKLVILKMQLVLNGCTSKEHQGIKRLLLYENTDDSKRTILQIVSREGVTHATEMQLMLNG